MNIKKLKMGIIGMGMAFEKLYYSAYQKLCDKYEIVTVCDPTQGKKWKNNWD